MRASYNHLTLKLCGESNLEKVILSADYTKTKLAYTVVENQCSGLNIEIGGTNCSIDLEKNLVLIGHKYLSENRIGYMLRIVVDAYILHNGGVPLHSSLLSIKDKSAFLFGNSNCGKSVLTSYIKEMDSTCKVVGDDHIIVSHMGFFGNSVFRVRSLSNDQDKYIQNLNSFHNKTEYLIFDIDINHKVNSYKSLSPIEYMQMDLTHVLKYLINDFKTEVGILKIDDIIKGGIKVQYLLEFEKFINNAVSIIRVRGDINYVGKFIYATLTAK